MFSIYPWSLWLKELNHLKNGQEGMPCPALPLTPQGSVLGLLLFCIYSI